MSELHMMVTIASRNQTKKFSSFYEELGRPISMITVGTGTAASNAFV